MRRGRGGAVVVRGRRAGAVAGRGGTRRRVARVQRVHSVRVVLARRGRRAERGGGGGGAGRTVIQSKLRGILYTKR